MTLESPEPESESGPEEGEPLRHETKADFRAESLLLEKAIGGWRGIIDSGVPTAVFVIAYLVTSQNLVTSVIAAIVAGLVIVIWRLGRREPLQQVLAGFAGVLISALVASFQGSSRTRRMDRPSSFRS